MSGKKFGFSVVVSIVMLLGIYFPAAASAAGTGQCEFFEKTGFNICNDLSTTGFLEYWNNNGGLPVFGYPISAEMQEKNPDTGQTLTVQYFERARFEAHPENTKPYDVLLGRFGDEVLRQLYGNVGAMEAWHPDDGYGQFFDKTGHGVGGFLDGIDTHNLFLDYWNSHGLDLGPGHSQFERSLALFGYPLTDVFTEADSQGNPYDVQYFERARFEYHPDLRGTPYVVLLGLFGHSVLTPPAPSNCLPAMQVITPPPPSNQVKVLVPIGESGTQVFIRDSRVGTDGTNNLLPYYFLSGTNYVATDTRVTFFIYPAGCPEARNIVFNVGPVINPDYANIVGPFFH